MRMIKVVMTAAMVVILAGSALGAGSVLTQVTKGELHDAVVRVLDANADTLKAWSDAGGSEFTFKKLRPNQKKHFTAFLGLVSTYKNSLTYSYRLQSVGMPLYDYYLSHNGIPSFDEADAFYRSNLNSSMYGSDNYQIYNNAMLAKAGAISNIFDIMNMDTAYSKADKKRVLNYAIETANYVYQGAPAGSMNGETVASRDKILAELKKKMQGLK